VFLCQPASNQSSGQVYTPNIPDPYFNSASAFSSDEVADEDRVYIFSLPPESPERNCSGCVTAVQFCYRAKLKDDQIGVSRQAFTLLMMTGENLLFRVSHRLPVRVTPSSSNCVVGLKVKNRTPHDCCTSVRLPDNRFQIASSNITFGVWVRQLIRPFLFDQHFQVEQFQFQEYTDSFTLTDGARVHGRLFLLRFLIGESVFV
jgi:hypothetical protein